MKKILLTLNFIIFSILTYSQTKTYEALNGKILTEEEYNKAKVSSLENAKKNLGSDYELYEKLEISEENKNEIKYKFKWEYLNKEMFAEKLIEEKLIGKTLKFENLHFLNPKEKNNLDKNKPTFVNFWFTSCPPCIEEMPALNELKEKYKDKINFVSITFDTKEKVEKFLTKYNFDFTHIVGEKEFTKSLGFVGYPKTFLLDNNKVIKSIKGSLPAKENEMAYKAQMELMEKELEKLL
ncbi:MAG: TlpA family protein disulfide reductase [Pedobacter sp.]|nr:MAG: TlpA family protein disulfide reductase [Pedobacter sp.]